jgi:hypothetical protein
MGRSVDYLSHALHVVYIDVDYPDKVENEDGEMVDATDFDNECHWDWFTETITENLPAGIKSLDNIWKERKWDGDETRIIFENKHCEIGLSEYCGIASISIRDKDNSDHPGLAIAWAHKVWPRIVRNLHDTFGENVLIKLGTFSNGQSVYDRMKP